MRWDHQHCPKVHFPCITKVSSDGVLPTLCHTGWIYSILFLDIVHTMQRAPVDSSCMSDFRLPQPVLWPIMYVPHCFCFAVSSGFFFFFSNWLLNSVYLLKFSWRFCLTWLLSTCSSTYYIIIQEMSSTKEKRENLQCCGRNRMDEEKQTQRRENWALGRRWPHPLMSSEEWTVNL